MADDAGPLPSFPGRIGPPSGERPLPTLIGPPPPPWNWDGPKYRCDPFHVDEPSYDNQFSPIPFPKCVPDPFGVILELCKYDCLEMRRRLGPGPWILPDFPAAPVPDKPPLGPLGVPTNPDPNWSPWAPATGGGNQGMSTGGGNAPFRPSPGSLKWYCSDDQNRCFLLHANPTGYPLGGWDNRADCERHCGFSTVGGVVRSGWKCFPNQAQQLAGGPWSCHFNPGWMGTGVVYTSREECQRYCDRWRTGRGHPETRWTGATPYAPTTPRGRPYAPTTGGGTPYAPTTGGGRPYAPTTGGDPPIYPTTGTRIVERPTIPEFPKGGPGQSYGIPTPIPKRERGGVGDRIDRPEPPSRPDPQKRPTPPAMPPTFPYVPH